MTKDCKVTYHQQVSYCGKPRCRKCREGTGHGPYWYAYKTVDGRSTRSYVGKTLPPEALRTQEGAVPAVPPPQEVSKLYGGDFLPEEHTIEWTLARRESLKLSWISALLDLSDLRAGRLALSSAIDPLNKLLTTDPANEAAVQRLMRLLKHLGRRGE